jgi:hypothetical protein
MPQQPSRPLRIDMKVANFDARDRLEMICPCCGRQVGRQGTDLRLELPADFLLIRYVVRHFCQPCFKLSGLKIRPNGWIVPYHLSGAESGHQTQWAQ